VTWRGETNGRQHVRLQHYIQNVLSITRNTKIRHNSTEDWQTKPDSLVNQSAWISSLLCLHNTHTHTTSTMNNSNHRSVYIYPDAVPPIHAVSYHVATDKVPTQNGDKFPSIFSDNLQPIASRGKKASGTLLVDKHCGNGCSIKRAPLSISYYNKISGGHIGWAVVRTRCSACPVLPLWFKWQLKTFLFGINCNVQRKTYCHTIIITWNNYVII